ncbi:MAG: guanylate kinase [Armatimonadetes bacterium]|nr:guanylate kinase [Armatimonadota bacterium]
MLLVVAGPSGVGKGTLIRELLQRHPDIEWSVSCTTRAPRPGERDGVDYHFISEGEFARMVRAGELLEWALVHGTDHYGTPREPVERALSEGRDIVLEIDYQGARSVRSALPEAVMVFVAPPDIATLLHRLSGRNTEDAEAVRRRMSSAYIEFSNMGMFEYVLVNDDLATACDELEAVYTAERMRSRRCGWQRLRDLLLADMDERLR